MSGTCFNQPGMIWPPPMKLATAMVNIAKPRNWSIEEERIIFIVFSGREFFYYMTKVEILHLEKNEKQVSENEKQGLFRVLSLPDNFKNDRFPMTSE